MAGLKTYLPQLGSHIGKGPKQLNAWLRALVAAKALTPRPGRGPGSGVELSGKSVSVLLLAVMASDIRGTGVKMAKSLAVAKPEHRERCPITQATNLRDALAHVLEAGGVIANGFEDGHPAKLVGVEVYRDGDLAKMLWLHPERPLPYYVTFERKGAAPKFSRLSVICTVNAHSIGQIAADLQPQLLGVAESSN